MKHIKIFESFPLEDLDYEMIAGRLREILVPNIVSSNRKVRVNTKPKIRNDFSRKGGSVLDWIQIDLSTNEKDTGILIKGVLDPLLAGYDRVIGFEFVSSKNKIRRQQSPRFEITRDETTKYVGSPDRYYGAPFPVIAPDEETAISIIIATIASLWNNIDALEVHHGDDVWEPNGDEGFYTNQNTGQTLFFDEPPERGEHNYDTITNAEIVGMKNSVVAYLKDFTDPTSLAMASRIINVMKKINT